MMTRDELMEYAREVSNGFLMDDVLDADVRIMEKIFQESEIIFTPGNRFFADTNLAYFMHKVIINRKIPVIKQYLDENGKRDGAKSSLFSGGMDFGHTCPGWEEILSLGIFGLRKRAEAYYESEEKDLKNKHYYGSIVRVYDAAIAYMRRVSEKAAQEGLHEMAAGLTALTKRAPETLFEAIQTMVVYYMLQHTVEDSMVRTFGRLDSLLYPFFVKEQDRENAVRLICDFVDALEIMDPEAANLPFALGGVDKGGRDASNELSYVFLDAYKRAPHQNVKIHLLIAKSTPDALIECALSGVRNGNNSICFFSDETVAKSLMKIGAKAEDARSYAVLGCYEGAAYAEIACTSAGKINIAKALEMALFGGVDQITGNKIGLGAEKALDSYEAVFDAFADELRNAAEETMKMTDHMERHSRAFHAAPFFTSSFDCALKQGGDIFNDHRAKYNNTSIVAVGLATAADSLYAIKKLVFEDRTKTLQELTGILRNDWEGEEVLRQTVKNHYPKYGQGDERVDRIARDIVQILSDAINNHPNTKGGVYRLGVFSITWRWTMGEQTAATADGRKKGETLSLNTGASFGALKYGTTAHLISASQVGNDLCPDGAVCDIDLHRSSVSGENGLHAMTAALRAFFEMGGYSAHFNVLDVETLKKAKEEPELYPDLQVRLCGWNVRFSSLSEKEKDEYISRIDAAD